MSVLVFHIHFAGAGYDHVISYRGKDVRQLKKELRAVAPNGVNGYFDNAGGPCTEAVLQCLALQARVAVCGQIAYYNLKNPASARAYPATMIALTSCSKIEGFLVNMLPKKDPGNWDAAFDKLHGWLESGQLKVKEDVTEGLVSYRSIIAMQAFRSGGCKCKPPHSHFILLTIGQRLRSLPYAVP